MQYNSIRGDQWSEQMEVKGQKEERERARGVLLYLQLRYDQFDEKISNFDSFPEEIQLVLDKYMDVFDTKLRKSMILEPVKLNVKEGSTPYAYYSCRPTPSHYRETGVNLVKDLLDHQIIARCGDIRSQGGSLWHFAWSWIFLI